MGVAIAELVPKKEISFDDLNHKKVAIDALNSLYQFLVKIRQRDGTPLKDANGNVTSHLSGLFSRTTYLIEHGLKPIFVFDGKPPELKGKTLEKRSEIRSEAYEKWQRALKEDRIEDARKYAQSALRLTKDMIAESKELLTYMGIPVIDAPSEGEAQAAYMNKKGDVWAVVSQDYDSILFGATRIVRNLTVSKRKKIPKTDLYTEIKPEIINSDDVFATLNITREQFIWIAIMTGTDYNPKGIEGFGPKKGLKVIKSDTNILDFLKSIDANIDLLEEIKAIFTTPNILTDYTIKWKKPNEEKIRELLYEKHGFSKERVTNTLNRLSRAFEKTTTQTTLDVF